MRLALLRLLALQNFEVLFFHGVVIFFIIGVGSLFSLYFTGPGYMWMGVLAPLLFLPFIYCVWKLLLDNVPISNLTLSGFWSFLCEALEPLWHWIQTSGQASALQLQPGPKSGGHATDILPFSQSVCSCSSTLSTV